jgi:hypothetical protein
MLTRSGYLTSATNPNFSGLTKLVFRDELRPTAATQFTTVHCESGHGMRALVSALGVNGRLTQRSAETPVDYTVDELGLLVQLDLDSSEEG